MVVLVAAFALLASPPDLETLVADMTLPHVAPPNGLPEGVDWRLKPRVGWGNHMAEGWSAFIPWGQVYLRQGGRFPENTRVEIRNLRAYVLDSQTKRWRPLQNSLRVGGAAYVESFAEDANVPADFRDEPGGTVSIVFPKGHNFHFWTPEGRVALDRERIGGIVTAVEARLIPEDPAKPWNPSRRALMMSVGADYWKALDSQWDQWKTNGDVGIGRFRWITPRWTTYTMTSLSRAELEANPLVVQ